MTRKQDLHDRLQRAESWVKALDIPERKQLHEAFIFLYVTLNALYGRRQYEGRTDVHEDLHLFLDRVNVMHVRDVETGLDSAPLSCLAT